MPVIHLGAWQVLPSQGGSAIALDGDCTAVGGLAGLVVWRNTQQLHAVEAPWPAPGRPRIAGARVFWGPGMLDLDSGQYRAVEAARPAMKPGGGERPQVYAWSARGDRMLVSSATGEPACPARVVLFDANAGHMVSTLWEGSDLPPQTALVGQRWIVVGFNDPRVFDATSGAPAGHLALGGGIIARIDADDDERIVIVVDLNRSIALIDPDTWSVLNRWDGRWQDAAIAPDGRVVAAVDFSGRLHIAALQRQQFQPVHTGDGFPQASSVALGRGMIGLAGGGIAARATLHVD